MTTHVHGSRPANVVSCYCRKCGKEFEITIFGLVRRGCYCSLCYENPDGVVNIKTSDIRGEFPKFFI